MFDLYVEKGVILKRTRFGMFDLYAVGSSDPQGRGFIKSVIHLENFYTGIVWHFY